MIRLDFPTFQAEYKIPGNSRHSKLMTNMKNSRHSKLNISWRLAWEFLMFQIKYKLMTCLKIPDVASWVHIDDLPGNSRRSNSSTSFANVSLYKALIMSWSNSSSYLLLFFNTVAMLLYNVPLFCFIWRCNSLRITSVSINRTYGVYQVTRCLSGNNGILITEKIPLLSSNIFFWTKYHKNIIIHCTIYIHM
jgi:hypothetical protein